MFARFAFVVYKNTILGMQFEAESTGYFEVASDTCKDHWVCPKIGDTIVSLSPKIYTFHEFESPAFGYTH